jgi:hypothetical protein
MAANSLMDRGWGKAAQLVDVQGELRQLVEVKLNVVPAARTIEGELAPSLPPPSSPAPSDEHAAVEANEINLLKVRAR